MKKILIFIISFASFSVATVPTPDYDNDITVKKVEWDIGSGYVRVFFAAPASCTNCVDRYYKYSISSSSDNAKSVLSIALTAFSTGSKINIFYSDYKATSDASVSTPGTISSIYIHQ